MKIGALIATTIAIATIVVFAGRVRQTLDSRSDSCAERVGLTQLEDGTFATDDQRVSSDLTNCLFAQHGPLEVGVDGLTWDEANRLASCMGLQGYEYRLRQAEGGEFYMVGFTVSDIAQLRLERAAEARCEASSIGSDSP